MSVQLQKRLFTVKEYHLMTEAGILSKGDRVELIEGEIIQMAAIGTRHASSVKRLLRQFNIIPYDQAIIGVQDPIQLTERTEPQPDFVLLQPRADYYATAHPVPSEVLLLVEVSDSTVDYDRDVKVSIRPLAKIIRTGKMPIPQEKITLVGWASCPSHQLRKRIFARGLFMLDRSFRKFGW